MGVRLWSIAPDGIEAWRHTAEANGLSTPLLSDPGNGTANAYGVMRWRMGDEPGHTFVVIDAKGIVRSIRDYGAPQHGGLMYVEPREVIEFLEADLR